jgi:hypothetical protein
MVSAMTLRAMAAIRASSDDLTRRQRFGSPRYRDLTGPQVQGQSAGLQHHGRRLIRSPQACPDPCEQLGEAERLDDVVVGPSVEVRHTVGDGILRCQNDHG